MARIKTARDFRLRASWIRPDWPKDTDAELAARVAEGDMGLLEDEDRELTEDELTELKRRYREVRRQQQDQ